MKKVELFPSILIKHNLKSFKKSFLNIIKKEKYQPSLSNSHNGSYTCDVNILNKKEFKNVKKEILEVANIFAKKHLSHEVDELKISCSWGAKLKKNNLIPSHTHINSYISGVFYLNTGTPIQFHSPVLPPHIFPKLSSFNKFNFPIYEVNPTQGLCLLFPSSFTHSVPLSKNSSTRYSIGFNIVPVGKIGFDTANLNIV